MARSRKKRRSKKKFNKRQRDTINYAKRHRLLPFSISEDRIDKGYLAQLDYALNKKRRERDLRKIYDGYTKDVRNAFSKQRHDWIIAKMRDTDIYRAEVCQRRLARRTAMFALRKIGKGVSGPKFKRYTNKSKVRC